MPKIIQMAQAYIQDTAMARLVIKDEKLYFVFLDTYEFIPIEDLGYNSAYGFYSLSQFPDVVNEAELPIPQTQL